MENSLPITQKNALLWLIGAVVAGLTMAKGAALLTSAAIPKKPSAPQPQQVLSAVYHDANLYFLGDTLPLVNKLNTYCSKPLLKAFQQVPGIMVYTFARETHNGQLRNLTILSQEFKGKDSALIKARANYRDGSSKTFEQHFIKEDERWKLGLKYGHDIQ